MMTDNAFRHSFTFRVRYAETDQMGTFYNARALEWFEVGRSELARAAGLPYTEWEKRGAFLPLTEAHVKYQGRAQYDDELRLHILGEPVGRVRLRFDVEIVHASSGKPVCSGYTIHPVVNAEGRPVRVPDWALELLRA